MTLSIADTIHDAIEKRLWDGAPRQFSHFTVAPYVHEHSCAAAQDSNTRDFLQSLGWPAIGMDFLEFPRGKRRQYARALALTFAELIAREENL